MHISSQPRISVGQPRCLPRVQLIVNAPRKSHSAKARGVSYRTIAALTTDAPSSTSTSQNAAERVAGFSGIAQQALPKLTGQTVVISGGSQGVGRATAELFAKNGYNVVIAARNPQKLSEAMEQLSRRCAPGRACLGISTDITKGDAVDDLVAQVTDKCESVDILINCAGVCLNGSLKDTSFSDFQEQMNVNFFGAVAMTKGFQDALLATARRGQSKPVIVNVNSFGGRIPLRNMAAYSASKFALAGFHDSIKPELADMGIHMAQVHPGVVKSNFMERAGFRGVDGDKQRAQMQSMLESSPAGLVQSPEEVAEQVYMAAIRRKDEVFVGAAYNAINTAFRTFNVNPFSMARP
ncbi:g1881 [Coccomyxa viridis]|uniref:G1881 protein n=1 Tax=Coccomyxa viridis TaxID=1274662 RepID=A0ABP1FMT4_9CHLO